MRQTEPTTDEQRKSWWTELCDISSIRPLTQEEKDIARLLEDYRELVKAVKTHRDQRGDNRCFLDDLELYKNLPDTPPDMAEMLKLPPKQEFLKSCERYWAQRQPDSSQGIPYIQHKTMDQLEHCIHQLRMLIGDLHLLKDDIVASNQVPDVKLANLTEAIDKTLKNTELMTGPIAFALGDNTNERPNCNKRNGGHEDCRVSQGAP